MAAIRALAPLVVGATLERIDADMGGFWRRLVSDTQLRWLGPEKGVIHLAAAAVVNAVWDLWAKLEGKPLWKLLADLSPEELVACVDFRYIDDVVTPGRGARAPARRAARARRARRRSRDGLPAYTTSAGWLGYEDDEARGARARVRRGGLDAPEDEGRRATSRPTIAARARPRGDRRRRRLMMDANQVWDVDEAIAAMRALDVRPLVDRGADLPGRLLGHARIARDIAPIRVATGEHFQNRIVFKQLLQAEAIGFCQLDACRLGGVNEVIAVLLLAAKFGVPVCPHAGGVGLCEYVQHLAIFDYLAVSASLDDRFVECVDHLHEHFVQPAAGRDGRYLLPLAPGYSIEMLPASREEFAFPDGAAWTDAAVTTTRGRE